MIFSILYVHLSVQIELIRRSFNSRESMILFTWMNTNLFVFFTNICNTNAFHFTWTKRAASGHISFIICLAVIVSLMELNRSFLTSNWSLGESTVDFTYVMVFNDNWFSDQSSLYYAIWIYLGVRLVKYPQWHTIIMWIFLN